MKCKICYSLINKGMESFIDYPSENTEIDKIEVPSKIIICKTCKVGMAEPMLDEKSLDLIYGDSIYWSDTLKQDLTIKNFPTAFSLAESRWDLIREFVKLPEEPRPVPDGISAKVVISI